jgi:hypothetical protein
MLRWLHWQLLERERLVCRMKLALRARSGRVETCPDRYHAERDSKERRLSGADHLGLKGPNIR